MEYTTSIYMYLIFICLLLWLISDVPMSGKYWPDVTQGWWKYTDLAFTVASPLCSNLIFDNKIKETIIMVEINTSRCLFYVPSTFLSTVCSYKHIWFLWHPSDVNRIKTARIVVTQLTRNWQKAIWLLCLVPGNRVPKNFEFPIISIFSLNEVPFKRST